MKSKDLKPLKTKRLEIVPMTEAELKAFCERQKDEHLRSAFEQMLERGRQHFEEWGWYACWAVRLRESGVQVGNIAFFGPPNDRHEVEISYGIEEEHRREGYAAEAIKVFCEYAFSQGAYYVRAQTKEKNMPSQKALSSCGFKGAGRGAEGLLWELEAPPTGWFATYLGLGLCLGSALGYLLLGNMTLGIGVGLCIGVALGTSLDAADKKKRKRE